MRRISASSFVFAAVLAAGSVISATSPVSASEPSASRYGPAIGLGIGTLGIVGEASFKASSQFVVRVNGNWGQLDFDETVDANDYSGSMKIWGAGLIGDWHPFSGSFRLAAACATTSRNSKVRSAARTSRSTAPPTRRPSTGA